MSLRQWLCYLKITQGAFCFDCLSRAHYGSCCLSISFFLKLKRKIFEMMPWWYWKFVHSFILYLISDFSHYPSQTISPCSYPTPQLPIDCNFSTGFRWQRRGGVATLKEKKTHEKRNIAFTLLRPIFKKAFFWLWAGQKRKKTRIFAWCLTNNAVDHLTIGIYSAGNEGKIHLQWKANFTIFKQNS